MNNDKRWLQRLQNLNKAAVRLDDLVKLLARIAELNLSVDPDFLIRADIKNPDLEEHIRKHGIAWYSRAPTDAKGLGYGG
ncbi:MAG TPA: hypothetical protein PKE12_11400 [Kiritimatiellia bacterium]|nr:hypothetical protein [Kiritimatiellia bacterium]